MELQLIKTEVISEHWIQVYYSCPCGKGTIVKADFNYSFEMSDCWILCPECRTRYTKRRIGQNSEIVQINTGVPVVLKADETRESEIVLPAILYSTQDGTINLEQLKGSSYLKNPDISRLLYGRQLATILITETEHIQEENNHFYLNTQKNGTANEIAMKILGSVAEAVIVRRCNENENINNKWFELATRKKRVKAKTSDRYRAIGTGLGSTRVISPHDFNRTDPQHDVLWIDESRKKALIEGSSLYAGNYAGIQVKTAGSGIEKIIKALQKEQYGDPIAYFGLRNDFNDMLRAIAYRGIKVEPGIDIVNARDIDVDAYEEVMADYYILLELITRRLSVEKFLSDNENNIAINALLIGNYVSKQDVPLIAV